MDLQGRPEPEALAGPAVERNVHRGDLVVAGELLTAVHGYRLARLFGEGRDLRGGYVGLRVGGVPAARQEAAPAVIERDCVLSTKFEQNGHRELSSVRTVSVGRL